MASMLEVIDGIISLIKKNIIAKTEITSDINTGDITVNVSNSFHFNDGEEIIIIDDGYNDEADVHYQIYEYAQIKKVVDTRTITLVRRSVNNWLVSKNAFIQKTIGSSPLYEDQVYYGDREVIATDQMAICVEPVSVNNEWIYIQGGLSEEYKVKVMIYGKSVDTTDGLRVLNRYADAVSKLLNSNLHIGIGIYSAPLLSNAIGGSPEIILEDTAENRENFVLSSSLQWKDSYTIQDNLGRSCGFFKINSISIGGGIMRVYVDPDVSRNFTLDEYAVFIKYGRYFYDSRATDTTYGLTQKGSAILRAAEIGWFGKSVDEYSFPQTFKNVEYLPEQFSDESSSTSSFSSLTDSSIS